MNKLFSKIATAFVGIAMAVGVGVAVGINSGTKIVSAAEETYIWSMANGDLGTESTSEGTSGTKVSGGITWSYTRKLKNGESYTGWTSSCIQMGKNGGVDNVTISTSDFSGTITEVSVECSSYNNAHKIAISVGGVSYLPATATAKWTTIDSKTTGSISASGEIVISFTDGSKALYLKSITVKYNSTPTVSFDDSNMALKTNNSSGITKSVTTQNVINAEYLWLASSSIVTLENDTTSTVTIKPNTDSAGSVTISLLVTGDNIDDYEGSFTVTISVPASYTISVTANHCTKVSGDTSILEGGEATMTFAADDGYNLPASVTSISGASVKTYSDGVLVINNPTDNVSITMTAFQYDNDFGIVSGGKYKIHHTKKDTTNVYYLKSNGTESVPSATLDSWEATIFTFTIIGDNEFYIKNGSDYLYTSNSNNGLRVGPTAQSWVLGNGTAGKTGAYELQNTTHTSRYLALYSTGDFRTYSLGQSNRTENTDLSIFDAVEFAKDVVNATKAVCDAGYNNKASDFTTNWAKLNTNYAYLSSADKTLLTNATYNLVESTVTATGGTNQTVAEGVARHDYLVAKYSLDLIIEGRTPAQSSNMLDAGFATGIHGGNFTILIIVSITSIAAISAGAFYLFRKKRNDR